jgi:8-oxo-dGTP pyrophosphatase MutT (NUDIX family)
VPGHDNDRPPVLAAGFVVVRRTGGETRFLLLRAYTYWDFPKGEVEPGEPPIETARRETAEETGLTRLVESWGESYRETEPYRSGRHRKVARYYLAESAAGEVTLPVSPELGRPEHHEARWATYEAARELLGERLRPVLAWARDLL